MRVFGSALLFPVRAPRSYILASYRILYIYLVDGGTYATGSADRVGSAIAGQKRGA